MENKLIYSKMAAILKDTGAIAKTERNTQQNFNFRSIDNVMNSLHEIFAKHEVFIVQQVESYETKDRQSTRGGVITWTRATIRFRYTTTDGSFMETVNVGEAMDSGDKGMNKAMSAALKYSLLQMFLIPTDEPKDPDADTPEEQDYWNILMQDIRSAKSTDTLTEIFYNNPALQNDEKFKHELRKRTDELKCTLKNQA